MINQGILFKAVITEKSFDRAGRGWYSFIIDRHLNKDQAKKIVEEFFKVRVVEIRSITVRGKNKRSLRTRKQIKESDVKKIVVKLAKDQKIELFEVSGSSKNE